MFFRTDIAIEANNNIKSSIDGIDIKSYKKGELEITRVVIKTEQASKKLFKPLGTYVTADIPILTDNCDQFPQKAEIISKEIKDMLPEQGLVLVAGLGNSNITADNLGPMTANNILATRHISHEIKKSLGLNNLRSVAVLSPGVLGQTGIETSEILFSVIKNISPVALIVIDAFASSDIKRLGTTVQISDSGISPGSGVMNSRAEISRKTMGIPVISIGVPTVIDMLSIVPECSITDTKTKNMIITTREIDLLIQRASKLLSIIINSLLQPDLSCNDMEILLS